MPRYAESLHPRELAASEPCRTLVLGCWEESIT